MAAYSDWNLVCIGDLPNHDKSMLTTEGAADGNTAGENCAIASSPRSTFW